MIIHSYNDHVRLLLPNLPEARYPLASLGESSHPHLYVEEADVKQDWLQPFARRTHIPFACHSALRETCADHDLRCGRNASWQMASTLPLVRRPVPSRIRLK